MEAGTRLSPESMTKRCRSLYIGGIFWLGLASLTIFHAIVRVNMATLNAFALGCVILAMQSFNQRESLLDMAEILKLLERQSEND